MEAYGMKRLLLILLLTIGVSAGLLAGDVAQFVNLGFSNDSRVFVFGQYGVSRDTSVPFASLFFVDVHKNDFIPNGTFQSTETQEVSVGQNGLGTLFNLVHQGTELGAEHGVNHSSQGRLVYLYINGDEPRSRVTFRDFNSSVHYEINLVQQSRETPEGSSAAFHLLVTATTDNGRVVTHTVGLPNFYRPGIDVYRMKQVVLSPDESSIVMVIERIKREPTGDSIDYMVETVSLF